MSALQHPVNRDTAGDLLKAVTELKASVDGIVKNMQDLAQAKQAARDAFTGTQDLLGKMVVLRVTIERLGLGGGALQQDQLAMFTLVAVALVAKVLLDDARDRAVRNEEENRREMNRQFCGRWMICRSRGG